MAKTKSINPLIKDICSAILSAQKHIENHLNRANVNDHSNIDSFQDEMLKNIPTSIIPKWQIEYDKLNGYSDSIDIFGENEDEVCMIEIDASRADQVAKKMLSRFALWQLSCSKKKLIYVAILYPQNSSSRNECEKYLEFGNSILKKLNKDSFVVGVYYDQSATKWQVWDFNLQSSFNIACQTHSIKAMGLVECAKTVVDDYIKTHKGITYPQLQKVFGRYVDTMAGPSRYSKLMTLADGSEVFVYTQWREYGYRSNWDVFVRLCKKIGYVISKDYLWITDVSMSNKQ